MRKRTWNRDVRQAERIRGVALRAANPLRGSPRRKPRSREELLALARVTRDLVRSGTRIEWLGPRRWRLVTLEGAQAGTRRD